MSERGKKIPEDLGSRIKEMIDSSFKDIVDISFGKDETLKEQMKIGLDARSYYLTNKIYTELITEATDQLMKHQAEGY